MSESNAPRPGHVTLAGWLVMVGSLAAVAASWQQVSTLHTIDTRDRVRQMLAQPPLSDMGQSMSSVLGVMHGLALVTGACAAAAAVLGWFALQRSKPARLVLTIVAVPLLLAGMGGSGFWSTLAAASVVLLWLPPSRDWYDGVEHSEAVTHPAFVRPPEQQVAPVQPPPTYATPPMSAQQPPAWSGQWTQQAVAPAAHERRPAAVTLAGILTWIGSALFSASTLLTAVVTTADPSALSTMMRKQETALGTDVHVATSIWVFSLWFVTVVLVLLALAASIFAVLAWRRQEWARIALLVCSAIAAAFFLVSTLSSPATVIFFGAAIGTVSALLRPQTRAWFARR